ncbi:oligosaccharide flippase family protein [Phocaeicola sartorii]|uniref:oligosaccharide flippase family protein n=1 Tax=Phocaeicola sartorii TaxID=671267 RepID=UPI00248C16BD|nr:oligosaccharide flippase family protein [Phocaeicola sartorii]
MSLAKNSLLYVISTISVKATSFLLLPFYSHLISPDEYGYVYVITAFVNFMSLFMTLSLHGALARFFFDCESEGEVKQLYSTIVLYIFCISTFFALVLYTNSEKISDFLNLPIVYFKYGIFISYISVYYPIILSLLYSKQSAKIVSIASTILGMLGVAIQLIMVLKMDDKSLALIQTLLINAILSFSVFCWFSRRYLTIPILKMNAFILYIKYSVSQFPSDMSVWLVQFSDRLFINKFIGAFDAGIYGMGSQLGQIPQILFHSVNRAYVPFSFLKYKENENGNKRALDDIVRSNVMVVSILTSLIAILIVMSNNLIALLASQYAKVANVMPMVLIAIWIDCMRILFMHPLAYRVSFMKIKSMIWVLSAVLNIGLNFLLIPRFSIYGACFSLIVSYGLTCILIVFFADKAIKIHYQKKNLTQIIVLAILFSMTYFLGVSLWGFIIKVLLSIIFIYVVIFKCNDVDLKKWQKILFFKKN